MFEKLSKRDNHKILNIFQQEIRFVSDVASLVKYGQLDKCKKNDHISN